MGHGQCFGFEFGLDPDSVGSLSSVPILMATERAGLEQQRREGYRRLAGKPTVRYHGLQRRANNPHKRTKVAI